MPRGHARIGSPNLVLPRLVPDPPPPPPPKKRGPKPKPQSELKPRPAPQISVKDLVSQVVASLTAPPKPDPDAPEPLHLYKDRPMADENGKLSSTITYPQQKTLNLSYAKELHKHAQLHSYRQFLSKLDLEELKHALAQHDSRKALAFLSSLVDPANKDFDIAEIAMFHKISLPDLMQIWRSSRLTLAMLRLFDAAPDAVADAALDARSGTSCCARCDGAGQVTVQREDGPAWIPCPNCDGEGKVRRVGDQKSRETIFKATGILKQVDPMGMHLTVNTKISTVDSVLDELEEAATSTTTIDVK